MVKHAAAMQHGTWRWKSLYEARQTEEEAGRVHPYAEQPAVGTAPPLCPGTQSDRWQNMRKWWDERPAIERERMAAKIRRGNPIDPITGLDGQPIATELFHNDVIRIAWETAHPKEPPYGELPESYVQSFLQFGHGTPVSVVGLTSPGHPGEVKIAAVRRPSAGARACVPSGEPC